MRKVWGAGLGRAVGALAVAGFAVGGQAGTLEVVHAFEGAADGAWPHGGVVVDAAGAVYGTTITGGGEFNAGTLFRIKDGRFRLLHTFTSGSDGEAPQGDLLISRAGVLYGTTFRGGDTQGGTIFRYTAGQGYERMATLGGGGAGGSGLSAAAGLAEGADGRLLYGTTYYGGDPRCRCGTVFSIDTGSAEVRTLHAFRGRDGANPQSGVTLADGASLAAQVLVGTTSYGVTSPNGLHGRGALYRLDVAEGAIQAIATRDGKQPYAGLTATPDGHYWGANGSDGPQGGGSVFRIDAQGRFETMHAFGSSLSGGGSSPSSTLLLASDGKLYGTTTYGGSAGCTYCGTVFRIDPATGLFETLHSFVEAEGSWPNGRLAEGPGGWIYGITQRSGAFDFGMVYRLKM